MGFSELLGQIVSFERRLRGAAQMPLALPYPLRTWPRSGTWAERDKREVRIFLYFGRYTPQLFLQMQSLNERNYGKTLISKLASFPNWLLISSPQHDVMVTPRSVWPIVLRLLFRCFSISDFTVESLCSSVVFVGGRSPPNGIITPINSVRADSSC